MDNGPMILGMDGEFSRIKIRDIAMLETGNKIGSMDLVDKSLL